MGLRDIILKLTGLSGSRRYFVDNIASPDLVASILVIFAKSDGGISPKVIAADQEKDAREMDLLSTLVEALRVSEKTMDGVYARYFARGKSTGKGGPEE